MSAYVCCEFNPISSLTWKPYSFPPYDNQSLLFKDSKLIKQPPSFQTNWYQSIILLKDLDLCTTFPWWNVSRSYPVLTSEPLSKMPPKLIQLHTFQSVMGKVILVVSVYSCRNHFLALHTDTLPAWLLTFFFFFNVRS